MIIDYNKRKDISEEQRLASLKDSIQRALDEIEKRLQALENKKKG